MTEGGLELLKRKVDCFPKSRSYGKKRIPVQRSLDVFDVAVIIRPNRCFYQIKELSGIFLPGLSPCRSLSLSSLKVDKLTFQSAAKNLTHGLDLLSPSIYLLTTSKINKAAKETWFKSELDIL